MIGRILLAGLFALGLVHALPVAAQPYYGPTRLVSATWSEEKGPTGGQCVDVPGESKAIGTVLSMHACHNKPNQFFELLEPSLESARIAVYSGRDQRCLGYQAPAGKVILVQCPGAPRWSATASGYIATDDLKHCMWIGNDGRLELLPSCPSATHPEPRAVFGSNWQMATLARPYGNVVAVVSEAFRKCIDVRGGAKGPGSALMYYTCTGNPNQTLDVRGDAGAMFLLVYRDRELLCLSNVADGGNPASTQAVPCNRKDPRQQWNRRPDPFPTPGLRLRNARTGRCLDAFANSRDDVGSWPCHGDRNQAWLFVSG